MSEVCSTENVETTQERRKNRINMTKRLLEKPNKLEEISMPKNCKKLISKSSLIYICISECSAKGKHFTGVKTKFNEK